MKPLGLSDRRNLIAALGWLELGSPIEATAELSEITPSFRTHPFVLRVRWCVYAAEGNWHMALETGRVVRLMNPTDIRGWVLEAESLHELGRTEEAWELLLPAASLFPDEPLMSYLLACYASALGCLSDAESWLSKTIDLDDSPEMKMRVLDEPDLESLWRQPAGLIARRRGKRGAEQALSTIRDLV